MATPRSWRLSNWSITSARLRLLKPRRNAPRPRAPRRRPPKKQLRANPQKTRKAQINLNNLGRDETNGCTQRTERPRGESLRQHGRVARADRVAAGKRAGRTRTRARRLSRAFAS